MAHVYVTGHRNPDMDSIGAAIGYAELKQRLFPRDSYEPVRLGELNAQAQWALDRAGLDPPEFLPHVRLRACDVMRRSEVAFRDDDPVREVGLAMAEHGMDLIPIVDAEGRLAGAVTDRDLSRMYIRESRGASTFEERPVMLERIDDVLGGEVLCGEDRLVTGRLWVVAMDAKSMGASIARGDVVVVGDREDAQRSALELGVSVLVTSHGVRPRDEVLALAEERGAAVVVSPLDSYVTGRMIQLAVPCGTVMGRDPLTARREDLAADLADAIKEGDHRAAIVVDDRHQPVGIVARSDLVDPAPRQVLLVDHAEQAQSVPGIEEAQIVEILDHHHIGSIETRIPVKATFDPVGSTATLVVERFRREGREPKRPTATVLLAALLSDTVILTSPTTTERDERVAAYLEELLEADAQELGMEMFQASSDVSDLGAEQIICRDAKRYETPSGATISIAQIETVGDTLLHRSDELLQALEEERADEHLPLMVLMVTDIVAKGTHLLVAGETHKAARAFGMEPDGPVLDLPGVMSRKKQVAPKLLQVF